MSCCVLLLEELHEGIAVSIFEKKERQIDGRYKVIMVYFFFIQKTSHVSYYLL